MRETSKSPLFRQQALEYYLQSREKAILPRIAKPSAFLLLWILLGLASAALMLAWFGRVPVYVAGAGVVTERTYIHNGVPIHQALALIFVPLVPAHPLSLHAGTAIQLQIGTRAGSFTTIVDAVEPGILSPAEIQRRYAPGNTVLISGPSIVISAKLSPPFTSQIYTGSFVHAQIQVDSISLFSSVFGSAQRVGD